MKRRIFKNPINPNSFNLKNNLIKPPPLLLVTLFPPADITKAKRLCNAHCLNCAIKEVNSGDKRRDAD